MNKYNTTKLKELIHDHGFLPDGDLLEFGEIIIEECMNIVSSCDPSPEMIPHEPYISIQHKIRDYFYGKPERRGNWTRGGSGYGALPPGWVDDKGTLQDGSEA